MTFFIIAGVLATIAVLAGLLRLVAHDGHDTIRYHPPRSHLADQFDRMPTQLR